MADGTTSAVPKTAGLALVVIENYNLIKLEETVTKPNYHELI